MRLFYAVILPDGIKGALDEAARSAAAAIRTAGGRVKPVEAGNMHITLRFLGDTPDEALPRLTGGALGAAVSKAMDKWGGDPVGLSVAGTGGFPDLRRARVLWAGVRGATGLLGLLNKELDALALSVGLGPERGKYSPHVTLCRIPEGLPMDSVCLDAWKDRYRDASFGGMDGWEACLYRSDLSGSGPTYTVMDTCPVRV